MFLRRASFSRFSIAITAAASVVLSTFVVVASSAPASAAPAALTESFTGSTLTNPSDWLMSASDQPACLTALAESQSITLSGGTVIRGCAGVPDAAGSGALQLTRLHGYDATTMLYNRELPTAGGLDVSFFIAEYSSGYWGADGISFFTKLGSVTDTSTGREGGGLGYTGVHGGLFGIGFDAYYNWTQSGPLGGGALCGDPTAELPADPLNYHFVALRGPDTSTAHDGSGGFCYITGAGGQGPNDLFTHPLGTRADAARPVRIIVDPATAASPKIRVYMWRTGDASQDTATAALSLVADEPAQYRAAPTFKFGFSAGTGGSVNINEVWGLRIGTVSSSASPTLYAVPQSETITAGATPAYAVKLYSDAAHTVLVNPTTVGGYSAPVCTSAYNTSMLAASQYPITCTGGAAPLRQLIVEGPATLTVLAGTVPKTDTGTVTAGNAVINGRASATSLPWGSVIWDTVTVHATTARGTAPTGTVNIYSCYNPSAPVGSCTETATSHGAVTLVATGSDTATAGKAISGLPAGYYMFYARYGGNETFTATAESGTDGADRFQITKVDPAVKTGASETVTVGDLLTVDASLGFAACATDGAPNVTLWLRGNPASATQPNTDTMTLGTFMASAAKWTGATTGWQPGVYTLFATFNGSANCNIGTSEGLTRITVSATSQGTGGGATDTSTTDTADTKPASAMGGGWFTTGGIRQSFGFQVQTRVDASGSPSTKGQLTWQQNGKWKFKGTLTTYESGQSCRTGAKTISTCARATGTGTLSAWVASGTSGKWVKRSSGVGVTILFSATTASTKKKTGSPGYFGIGFEGVSGSPVAPTASTALNALQGGNIKIK